MAKSLDELFQYLDGLTERASLGELTAELAELEISCDDVAEFVRFSDRRYQRNLMRVGEWFHVWIMCWKNGQRSPIHDHAESSCAVRILRGTATETTFVFAPNGMVKAVSSRDLAAGHVCGTADDDLHQISNLQAGSADLVTLHVYTPPLVRMGTYSLTDPLRGEDVWEVEFCDAAGI